MGGGPSAGCGKTGTSAVHQLSRSSAVSASPRTLLPPSMLLLSVVAAAPTRSLPPPPPPSPSFDGLLLCRGTLECERVFVRRTCGRRELFANASGGVTRSRYMIFVNIMLLLRQ